MGMKPSKPTDGRCLGKIKSGIGKGERCMRFPSDGSNYCKYHDPNKPHKRKVSKTTSANTSNYYYSQSYKYWQCNKCNIGNHLNNPSCTKCSHVRCKNCKCY